MEILLQDLQPPFHCSVLQEDGARTRPSGVLRVFPRLHIGGPCGDGLQALVRPGHVICSGFLGHFNIKNLHNTSRGIETLKRNDGLNKGLNSGSFNLYIYKI